MVTSRSRACALPKQIFGFNFPTISSIVYAGGRTIPTIYFQVLWQLGFESATSYTWQCFYWLAFECQPLGVKTISVLHKKNRLWWGFHKCKCESDVQTNSRLPVPLSILVLKTNNANHMVTCYEYWLDTRLCQSVPRHVPQCFVPVWDPNLSSAFWVLAVQLIYQSINSAESVLIKFYKRDQYVFFLHHWLIALDKQKRFQINKVGMDICLHIHIYEGKCVFTHSLAKAWTLTYANVCTQTHLQIHKLLNVATNMKACLQVAPRCLSILPIHLPRISMKIFWRFSRSQFSSLYKKPDLLSLVIGIDLETLL